MEQEILLERGTFRLRENSEAYIVEKMETKQITYSYLFGLFKHTKASNKYITLAYYDKSINALKAREAAVCCWYWLTYKIQEDNEEVDI